MDGIGPMAGTPWDAMAMRLLHAGVAGDIQRLNQVRQLAQELGQGGAEDYTRALWQARQHAMDLARMQEAQSVRPFLLSALQQAAAPWRATTPARPESWAERERRRATIARFMRPAGGDWARASEMARQYAPEMFANEPLASVYTPEARMALMSQMAHEADVEKARKLGLGQIVGAWGPAQTQAGAMLTEALMRAPYEAAFQAAQIRPTAYSVAGTPLAQALMQAGVSRAAVVLPTYAQQAQEAMKNRLGYMAEMTRTMVNEGAIRRALLQTLIQTGGAKALSDPLVSSLVAQEYGMPSAAVLPGIMYPK